MLSPLFLCDATAAVCLVLPRFLAAPRLLMLALAAVCAWLPAARLTGWNAILQQPPVTVRRTVMAAISGTALLLAGCLLLNGLTALTLSLFGYHAAPDPRVTQLAGSQPGAAMLLQAATLIAAAPLYEEALYRLTLPRLLAGKLGFFPASMASAIVFAASHYVNFFPAMLFFGLVQSLLLKRFGFIAALTTHILYNTAVFAVSLCR